MDENIISYSPPIEQTNNKLTEEYTLLYNKFYTDRIIYSNKSSPFKIKCFKFELRFLWESYIGKSTRIGYKDMNILVNTLHNIKTDWDHLTKINDLNRSCFNTSSIIFLYLSLVSSNNSIISFMVMLCFKFPIYIVIGLSDSIDSTFDFNESTSALCAKTAPCAQNIPRKNKHFQFITYTRS